jgi:quercetin dioxygenase-like cupin family protein
MLGIATLTIVESMIAMIMPSITVIVMSAVGWPAVCALYFGPAATAALLDAIVAPSNRLSYRGVSTREQGRPGGVRKASRMRKRFLATLAMVLLVAPAYAGAADHKQTGLTILVGGDCVAQRPVAGPWDVYEDMFAADAPTWLPTHTHNGIECTLGTRGTTMWWFAGTGKVPIKAGTALYTIQGRVHTAGNDGPAPMTYFAVHVLVAGSPYRTLVPDPKAPKVVSTNGASLFHNIFPNQPAIAGTFTTRLRLYSLASGGSFGETRNRGVSYYTVVSGSVAVTVGGTTTTYAKFGQWSVAPGVRLDVHNAGSVAAEIGAARVF